MSPEELDDVRSEVVQFLQDIVAAAGLELQVSTISDEVYRALTERIAGAELDWDWGIQFLNADEHFDLAIGIRLDEAVDGVAVGVYQEPERTLEIQAIEAFVRDNIEHPLRGRMTALTVIAATFFLLQVEGQYLHVIDPVDERLIEHYRSFGLVEELQNGTIKMVASVDVLEERLDSAITRFNLSEGVAGGIQEE